MCFWAARNLRLSILIFYGHGHAFQVITSEIRSKYAKDVLYFQEVPLRKFGPVTMVGGKSF